MSLLSRLLGLALFAALLPACIAGAGLGYDIEDLGVARGTDLGNPNGGADGGLPDDPGFCAGALAHGVPAKLPVDIILVVDNSGSMRNKIHGIELNINQHLTSLLDAAHLDYRVIVLSNYGDWTNNMICPAPPLSNNDCTHPVKGPPKFTSRYVHYDLNIQSVESLQKILSSYREPDVWKLLPFGWSRALRAGAFKVFIEVTDDNSAVPAEWFDRQLLALDPVQFGTAEKRNYVFNSIVGMQGNDTFTLPLAPSDPVRQTKCGRDAENASLEYQYLSILTGGLRFPVCEWGRFDGIFGQLTRGVVDGSTLPCQYVLPAPPPRADGSPQEVDPDSVVVRYTSPRTANLPIQLENVGSQALCFGSGFFLSPKTDWVRLCPATCKTVQADKQAALEVLYGCRPARP